ncbi:hypothetical protein R3P38DRAFT_3070345 [Favolaschia claudopus]|uniref:Uncharacterized protein n=1 Tax=Favolaschia claudopus TaxID=2862362 RepID=A0AAW0A1A8_9AGAR
MPLFNFEIFPWNKPPRTIEVKSSRPGYTSPQKNLLQDEPLRYRFPRQQREEHLSSTRVQHKVTVKPEPVSTFDPMASISTHSRGETRTAIQFLSPLQQLQAAVHQLLSDSTHNADFATELTEVICLGDLKNTDNLWKSLNLSLKPYMKDDDNRVKIVDEVIARIIQYNDHNITSTQVTALSTLNSSAKPATHPSIDHLQSAFGELKIQSPTPTQTNLSRKAIREDTASIAVHSGSSSQTPSQQLALNSTVQPFHSVKGSSGDFRYYNSVASYDLQIPPSHLPHGLSAGDLFIHKNSVKSTEQVWLFSGQKEWIDITGHWKTPGSVVHPEHPDRVLTVRNNGTPNWILRKDFAKVVTKNRSVSST